ncbi:MAG: GGDEF domain-containing protein [Lachnospiraceae bacterium]|nr:GGDEF domain-containing protein [Lachnospiraceae bacterium]
MIDTKFESAYAAGRFDLSLNIIDGNPRMFGLMDAQNYFSIYPMLNDNERKQVADAAAFCLASPGTRRDECVHIMTDGLLCCFILSIKLTSDGNAYDVELLNVSCGEERANELKKRLANARDYIALTGETLFAFYPASCRFHMYYIANCQNVTLYDMSLDDWIAQMLSQNRIADEDMESFAEFCKLLRKGESRQNCTFHGCIISDVNRLERYRINFVSKTHENGETVVIGTWAVIHETTGDTNSAKLEEAYIDSLTGLLNKKAVMEYAQNALQGENRERVAFAIMDIDNFKSVNDNYGHMFGDKVIKAVAEVISNAAENNAVVGRIGGDEFFLVFEKFTDEMEFRKLHGDFNVQNEDDIISVTNTFYSETDINALHGMLSELIIYGTESVPEVIDFFAHVLTLNRVSIFLNDCINPAYTNTLAPDVCKADGSVIKNLKYLKLFTNNLLTVSNLQSLEFSIPEVHRLLASTGVACMMQYTLLDREGEVAGLISADVFDRCSAFPKSAIALFTDTCRTLNAVFIRENLI